jgi:predicted transcriptional regulator YdeE
MPVSRSLPSAWWKAALLLLVAGLAGSCLSQAQDAMNPRIVDAKQFQIVGIEVSTNNAKEAGPDAVIGKQWRRFMDEGLLNKIPGRVDQSIIAVYTDFTSDAHGEYTFVLGAKVQPTPVPKIPEGMIVKSVPKGKYAVFTTPRGPAAKVVPETWKQIWAYYESPQHQGQRAYATDYEIYDNRATDPNNAQVDIYVGLK